MAGEANFWGTNMTIKPNILRFDVLVTMHHNKFLYKDVLISP